MAKIPKKVKYEDIEKPTITLKGEEETSIYVGKEYEDPGYEVNDNCDKNCILIKWNV